MTSEIIRLIFFGLFVPVTDLCLKWIWKAVYRSSHKRECDVERYKQENLRRHRRHNGINAWLIDTSPKPHEHCHVHPSWLPVTMLFPVFRKRQASASSNHHLFRMHRTYSRHCPNRLP